MTVTCEGVIISDGSMSLCISTADMGKHSVTLLCLPSSKDFLGIEVLLG